MRYFLMFFLYSYGNLAIRKGCQHIISPLFTSHEVFDRSSATQRGSQSLYIYLWGGVITTARDATRQHIS